MTRKTLKEVQMLWIKANQNQDFEKLKMIGRDIHTLLHIGNEILRLKRVLQDSVRVEDFNKCIEIRNEIQKHE